MKRLITEKQQAASRLNGTRSRGPHSPRGKAISSRNALKHGHLAHSVLLPGESPERFLALKNTYLQEFQPRTQPEFDLIDTLVVNRWRLLRNWTLETVSLADEQRRRAQNHPGEMPPFQAMHALRSLQEPPRPHEALIRHEVRLDRQYYKALDRLYRIQDARRARGTDDRAVCPPENAENDKLTKRTWEIIENKANSLDLKPDEKPRESRELPGESLAEPEENPSQPPCAA